MGGCNITTKQSGNDVNPHIKKLFKEITEKYIYELVKEATKRAIEDQAEKIDEKKIQKLQQKIKELSDDQKTNLFKGSEDEISKIIHQKDLNSEKIIEKINTTFKKTLDLNVRSLLPGIILPISTKLLLIIIAIMAIAFYGIPIIDDIINPDDPVENQLPELSIDPDPLNFNFGTMNEGDTDSRTFFILNTGSEILEWSITGNQPWIEVSQNTGTGSGTISVTANTADMDPGRHSGRITVESNGGTETGRISLFILRDNEPPEPTREPTDEPTLRPPRIHSFRANPDHIDVQGGETNLSWEVSDATSVIINGIEYVDVPMGSIQIWVYQTTNFTIRATNDAGISDARTITVNVEYEIPKLYTNPVWLDIGSIDKGKIKSETFSILFDGDGPLNWNIREYPSFVTVSPSYGTEPCTVTVSVDTAKQEYGDYTIDMIVESDYEEKIMYVYFNIPQPLLGPDLVVSNFWVSDDWYIEQEEYGEDQIKVNADVTIKNQGDMSAAIFKTSIECNVPGSTFPVPFTVDGQDNIWYPYTSASLDPGDAVTFSGILTFNIDIIEMTDSSVRAVADSCSGDEFKPDYCRVEESNEDNNDRVSILTFSEYLY